MILLILARVCSIHFDTNSFDIPLRQRLLGYQPKFARNLKSDAVPTLHLPSTPQNLINTVERSNRMERRERSKVVSEMLKEYEGLLGDSTSTTSQASTSASIPCYTSTSPQASTSNSAKIRQSVDEPMSIDVVEIPEKPE